MTGATINAIEDPQQLRVEQRREEAKDVVRVVNLVYEPGTRLTFGQELFIMPEKGETFRVPRRFAEKMIRSFRSGSALAFPSQVNAVKAAVAGNANVPPGFAVVSEEDAAALAEFRAQQALNGKEMDTADETAAILDELD